MTSAAAAGLSRYGRGAHGTRRESLAPCRPPLRTSDAPSNDGTRTVAEPRLIAGGSALVATNAAGLRSYVFDAISSGSISIAIALRASFVSSGRCAVFMCRNAVEFDGRVTGTTPESFQVVRSPAESAVVTSMLPFARDRKSVV